MDFAGLPILIPLKKFLHVSMSVSALAPPQRLNCKHCQALRSPGKDGIFTQRWDVPKLPSGLIGREVARGELHTFIAITSRFVVCRD